MPAYREKSSGFPNRTSGPDHPGNEVTWRLEAVGVHHRAWNDRNAGLEHDAGDAGAASVQLAVG